MTQAQKYQILKYLGWPLRTIDPTSTSYSNILTSRLASFPSDASDILDTLLERIEEVDGQLEKMVNRSNVKRVDDIEFFEGGSMELRGERRKLLRELASLLDFPMGPGVGGGSVGVCV